MHEDAMKNTLITAVAALIIATPVLAQNVPGGHFVENWDLDENGSVSFEEVSERRSDIFLTFDADDNGILNSEEYDMFDEARAADQENSGDGHGRGKNNAANAMSREFADTNADGQVTRDEFLAGTPGWFQMRDRNGDGVVTTQDFGPRS